jgi:hypothetical protein
MRGIFDMRNFREGFQQSSLDGKPKNRKLTSKQIHFARASLNNQELTDDLTARDMPPFPEKHVRNATNHFPGREFAAIMAEEFKRRTVHWNQANGK